MSSPTEDLHLRINALGAERTLQLLDQEQTRRTRIETENELSLMYEPHGIIVSDEWEISVDDHINHPPQIIPIENRSYNVNGAIDTFQAQRIDPNPGDTQFWQKVSGPSWVSVSNAGLVRIDPPSNNTTGPGRYNVRISVADSHGENDSFDFSITIIRINRAPVLSAVSHGNITLGETVTVNLSAIDADDDDITYIQNAGSGSLNPTTGVFEWTPSSTGSKTARFQARDIHGALSNERTLSFTVNPRPVIPPSKPVITRITNKAVLENNTLRFTARATDPDDLPLSWSKISGVGSITSAGLFTYAAGSVSSDTTHAVKLRVTATGGTPANEYSEITFNITVNNNRPPVLRAIGNKSVRRTETLTITLSATDPENNTISYSKTGVGSLNGNVFTYTPSSGTSLGNKSVKFTATATGGSDSETININVLAAVVYASRPVLEPIGDKSRVGAGRVSFRVKAKDPDDLPITFSPAAQFGTISQDDDDNYTAIYTSPNYAVGTHTVIITATATGGNPANETDSQAVVITVTAAPPPAEASPPVLRRILNISRTGTGSVSFILSAKDPDDLEITFAASAGTIGTVSQDNNGNYTAEYTSPSYSIGKRSVTITATATGGNPANETDSQAVVITVTAAILPPSPPVITGAFNDKTGTGTDSITFTVSDPNNLPLTVTATNGTITERTNDYLLTAQYPAAGQSKTVTIRAQATGGNPANEFTEISYVLTTPEIDYSPNITITSPINGASLNARRRNRTAGVDIGDPHRLIVSATRYNGEAIHPGQLQRSQDRAYRWPDTTDPNAVSQWFLSNDTSPNYHSRFGFYFGNITPGELTVTISYTDTVNNRAYTTETSVTVTLT